jgi:hypothetical protein
MSHVGGQVVQTRKGSSLSTAMALRMEMTSTDVVNVNWRTKVFQPNFYRVSKAHNSVDDDEYVTK